MSWWAVMCLKLKLVLDSAVYLLPIASMAIQAITMVPVAISRAGTKSTTVLKMFNMLVS